MPDDASTDFAAESSQQADMGLFDDVNPDPAPGRKPWLWLVLVLLVGIGGWWGYRTWQRQPQTEVTVVTSPVQRTTLENLVTAEGTVELGGQTTITAPDNVVIQTVVASEGERITAGEVLLSFRNRDVEQQLENQLIDNQIAQLNLQRKREILREKQADLKQAQERLVESKTLLEQEFISEDDYQDDQDRVDQASSSLRDAEVELQTAQLRIQQNQAETDNLRAKLTDNQILAPFDAVVLEVSVNPGDGVSRETELMVIGDPSQEMIAFTLSTLDAPKVKPGMPVRVGVIGPNQERYSGRIAWIAPQAASGDNGSGGQARVNVMAVLNRPSGVLIPGSSVLIEVVVTQQQDALAIPLNAVRQEGDAPFVWVKDADNTAQKRPVELGISTDQAVEVVSGLQAGDEVIVSLPAEVELTPNMPLSTGTDAVPEEMPQ